MRPKSDQRRIEYLANEFATCSAFYEIEPDTPLDIRLEAIALAEQRATGPHLQWLKQYRTEISRASLRIVK